MKYVLVFCTIIGTIFLVLFQLLVYKMPSDNMMPHIKKGSRLLVISSEYSSGTSPKNGEVVMYQTYKMNKPAFTRVAGCPGDTLSLNLGTLILNGTVYKEPYISDKDASIMPKINVPAGRYFLLNDNRDNLNDSRNKDLGMVRREDIKGKVILVF